MIENGLRAVDRGANPVLMREGIEKAAKAISDYILKNSKKVESNQDIANVGCFMDSIMDASVFYTDHRLLFPFNYSLGNDSRIFI